MGGAMDLVGSGKSRVVVLMEHAAKVGMQLLPKRNIHGVFLGFKI